MSDKGLLSCVAITNVTFTNVIIYCCKWCPHLHFPFACFAIVEELYCEGDIHGLSHFAKAIVSGLCLEDGTFPSQVHIALKTFFP